MKKVFKKAAMEGIDYFCRNEQISNVELIPLVDRMSFFNNFILIDPMQKPKFIESYYYQLSRLGFPHSFAKELKSYCPTPENQDMVSFIETELELTQNSITSTESGSIPEEQTNSRASIIIQEDENNNSSPICIAMVIGEQLFKITVMSTFLSITCLTMILFFMSLLLLKVLSFIRLDVSTVEMALYIAHIFIARGTIFEFIKDFFQWGSVDCDTEASSLTNPLCPLNVSLPEFCICPKR